MKTFALFAATAALVSQASGHYIFEYFTANGVKGAKYQYIRPNTDYNSPVTSLTSNDMRCNVGCALGTNTATVPVSAGASVSFTADVAVYHQGPVSIYMAKAPTTAAAYDGSGQSWFKILDIGPNFVNGGQGTWDLLQTYTFNIPKCLPDGEYLLRIQQIGIHNPAGLPQFYLECAQISVSGGGAGVPGPLVSIPGAFHASDPGLTVNIYSNFHNYTIPGPAVWKC